MRLRPVALLVMLAVVLRFAGACASPREDERVDTEVRPAQSPAEILETSVDPPPAAATPEGPPFQVGDDVEPPRIQGSRHIEGLVEMARSGRYSWGVCLFRVTLSEKGDVGEVEFLKPEDLAPEVRQVIVEVVREWKFTPATRDRRPVAVYYNLLVHHCPFRPIE